MPLDAQALEAHFKFDIAVGTVLPLFGGVAGGFCLAALDVGTGVVPLPMEFDAGVPVGAFGLAMPATGPGFCGVGGVTGLMAPPTTGAGLAAPPILFCGALAPPITLWAETGEPAKTERASVPASIQSKAARWFMARPRAL